MQGTVFRYDVGDGRHELYVGDVTTAYGLRRYDPSAVVTVTGFGATSYKGYGWATERELPSFGSVQELIDFLELHEASIGLVDFEAEINGAGRVSTHDDAECHFTFASRSALMATLKKVVPSAYEGLVIHALLNSPGMYITCSDSGILRRYSSFDAYLEAEP